jgi:hypothetical protein
MTDTVLTKSGVVVISGSNGHAVIAKGSPLRRLNYFDGKFLRATDLQLEQRAMLNQVRLSNQAGGSGVVHGYNCSLISGDRLRVGRGLAIDPQGRLLHLADEIHVGIVDLIEKSRLHATAFKSFAPFAKFAAAFGDCELRAEVVPDDVLEDVTLYLITAGHAEAFCGEEDVYGKLCEEACITSTERPYIIEGVVIRAVPLNRPLLFPVSQKLGLSNIHMRSRVASAFFDLERQIPASHISRNGLSSIIWCLGAEAEAGADVPIAVMARSGDSTLFLDAWIARRERMEAPPRHYWAGRMAMRPWNIFLAQVLQFQCQLATCFRGSNGKRVVFDPCEEERRLAGQASEAVKSFLKEYQTITGRLARPEAVAASPGVFEIANLKSLQKNLAAIARFAITHRYLINCGIVELPSAGYLPITPGDALTVNEQVRRLMGEGVDLRFCVVRPDYVANALEEAQHMERISLLEGIDDPSRKPRVDVLVPDGRIEEYKEDAPGTGYEMDLALYQINLFNTLVAQTAAGEDQSHLGKADALRLSTDSRVAAALTGLSQLRTQFGVRGAARGEDLESGGYAFYYAAQTPEQPSVQQAFRLATDVKLTTDTIKAADFLRGSALDPVSATADTAAEDSEQPSSERAEAATAATATIKNINIAKTAANYQRLVNSLRTKVDPRQPLLALWVELRSERDLFELPIGGSTQVTVKTVLVMSYETKNQQTLVAQEVSASGPLRVDDIDRRASEVRLTCRIRLDGVITVFRQVGSERTESSYPLRLDERVLVLRDSAAGTRPAVRVSVPNPSIWRKFGNIELRFERLWQDTSTAQVKAEILTPTSMGKETGGNPIKKTAASTAVTGTAMAMLTQARQTVPIFSGLQKINNDVLLPGHALHSASLSALALIGAALGDKGFAGSTAGLLFPPPIPVSDELKVYARRDWVLFHRRRDIVCEFDRPPIAVTQPRRFRVFHTVVDNDEQMTLLRNALLENRGDIIGRFDPQPVTLVEFEAGIPRVRTAHADVIADWQMQVEDDADIALGMVACRGASFDEGQALAEARLNSLVDVLGPVAELIDDAQLTWAPQVPDVLAHGEVDGVLVFATRGVATVCHEVHRVEIAAEDFGNFAKAFVNVDDIRGVLQEYGAEELDYAPKFRSETATLFGENAADELISAWGDKGDRDPYGMVTLLQIDASGNLPDDQPYADQTLSIATTVEGNVTMSEVTGVSSPLLMCPAISILVIEPQAPPGFNEVFALAYPGRPSDDIPTYFKELLQTEGLFENFPEPPMENSRWYPLGMVGFDADNVADIPSLNGMVGRAVDDKLLVSFGQPHPNLVYYVFSLSKQGADADQVDRDKAEAEHIRDALGLPRDVTEAVHGMPRWPSEGTAMTLVLIPTGFGRVVVTHGNLYAGVVDGADANMVTNISEKMSYDSDGNLIKDLAFETAVARLKREGTKLKTIEVVMTEKPAAGATDPRTEKLLAALKEAGVATKTAKVKLRVATDAERELISRLGPGATSGLVYRK